MALPSPCAYYYLVLHQFVSVPPYLGTLHSYCVCVHELAHVGKETQEVWN